MKFTLQITLGNDAVQTASDIEQLLYGVADQVAFHGEATPHVHNIRDVNGTTVGSWAFTEDREDILRKFAMPKPSEREQ